RARRRDGARLDAPRPGRQPRPALARAPRHEPADDHADREVAGARRRARALRRRGALHDQAVQPGGAGREGRAAARLTAGAAHPPRGREATRPTGASTTKGNPMRQIILTVTREERVIQQFAFAARTVTIGRVVDSD